MKNLINSTRKIELTTFQTALLVVLAIAAAAFIVIHFGHGSRY